MLNQKGSRRQFLKRTGVAITSAGVVGSAGCLGDSDVTSVQLGTATQGSGSYANGQALQRLIQEHSETVEIQALETPGGGAPNIRLYNDGEIVAGGCNSYDVINALEDTGQFADDPVDEVPLQGYSYMILHMYWLAKPDSGIETTNDLPGSNVWVQPAGVGMRPPINALLEATGLMDDMEVFEMDRSDVAGALEEDRIDAILAYGINYSSIPGYEVEVDSRIDLQAVEATDEFVEAIQDTPGVPHEHIEIYGRDQDVGADETHSWTQEYQWMFGRELSQDTVYEIARLSFEENEFAREADERFPEFEDPEDMSFAYVEDWPFHPGVAEYWREIGIWDEDTMIEGEL